MTFNRHNRNGESKPNVSTSVYTRRYAVVHALDEAKEVAVQSQDELAE